MRRRFVVGFGIAGIITGSALGQFASDRVPPMPAASPAVPPSIPTSPGSPIPPGYQPVTTTTPGAYTPPVGGVTPAGGFGAPTGGVLPGGYNGGVRPEALPAFRPSPPPADLEVQSALPANHPWRLKPEHGPYFICVKSYSRPSRPTPEDHGPSALAMAEALATEIRDLHRVQAFLFEYVSEERKAEMAAIARAREQGRIFAQQLDKFKQQSQLQGMEFLEPEGGRYKIHFKTVNYRDQIAVLVGGFQSEEDARKDLDRLRTWKEPTNKSLMDLSVAAKGTGNGKQVVDYGYINPYLTATVVPNPTIPRRIQSGPAPLEPFVVKLNEGRPYNLLKATKPWTLGVKAFNGPMEIVSKESGSTTSSSAMRKSSANKGADFLAASAGQAEAMAKMLRELKGPSGESLRLEAFVLHTRYSSMVTVGQFDGPNDPALLQTQNLLASMKMNFAEDKMGLRPVMNTPSLFGTMMPMPIPR